MTYDAVITAALMYIRYQLFLLLIHEVGTGSPIWSIYSIKRYIDDACIATTAVVVDGL